MTDLFEGYEAAPSRRGHDEMFDRFGRPRDTYGIIHDTLQPQTTDDLQARTEALSRAYRDRGVTFALSGEERPFPLDLVPRIIGPAEWARLEAGIVQRVQALEMFLDDVYGEGQVLEDGVVPRRLVHSSPHFHRQVYGLRPGGGVHIHVAGIDLIRDQEGELRVLEDNLRSPSGVSYVMENRRVMAQVFPELFRAQSVAPVDDYPRHLLRALQSCAPWAREPRIVVLTPGVHNSAYFEHALLARLMGVDLVEGRDIICRDDVAYVRTTAGEERVDVVFRRIDDDYLDPLQFRPDSILGVAGLVHAARAGNVSIANAVGNGVADDKLMYSYVPDIIEYYLGEPPILKNVETHRLGDPDARSHVLSHLDEMVVKPVDGSGGYGLVFGPTASDEELASCRADIEADPRSWIAQPVVTLSTAPTLVEGRLRPRHLDLRPFAINDGEKVWVLPGGLTRVALPEGSLVVNSSQGGGSKDTWVLEPARPPAPAPPPPPAPAVEPERHDTAPVPLQFGPADEHERLHQQQLQQQQEGPPWPGDSSGGGPC
ncbi:circularly permuted type 2 ATP-grasp protein [Iamia majanohamensis]|uniref:Circularly permuted type 2 ATP-grasp protein n=1 Tax=Iamia majanohamensis TaxID=467976 RepID=A0AAE9Y8C3_9ACTN|nr:circularly permuted type 2 ATP-grasp protein [Iamia majanohamensis]WCO66179.1 circularly permuted type 2 ATP-grasp protein [Iamia majanohamensis]